ncbi:hypothetical protein KAK07_23565 [Ideonella sp. 4Y16]|uniref:SIR2-like domain-containing protein n=1 Tax=Ideonella aquatica TaxID=2824119 RepID=A0A940YM74_9BURK|nr:MULTISPECIES: hypothetical protein [Ideonella]MBQ0946338.1 hypothetical protein [Ideonella alba]MBQ0960454.1 hypothetical protein [Ideonella aquatica]
MKASELEMVPISEDSRARNNRADEFLFSFNRSQAKSIDAFLARRSEFSDLGKLAIAIQILKLEQPGVIYEGLAPGRWFSDLLHAMDAPWDQMNQNRISFVTFNYDRSLEFALSTALQYRHGKTPNEVEVLMKEFPIVHAYGQLGSLNPDDPSFVQYGAHSNPMDTRFLFRAMQGIQVIPEGRDGSDTFSEAQALISRADAICFLGFGFDETNVRRLGGESILGSGGETHFAASAFHLTKAETEKALRSICHNKWTSYYRDRMFNSDCANTLRESLILG